MKQTFFIFAGESSGDLHGSRLMKALPEYSFEGVGGPFMRREGLACIAPMEDFQVMGFTDVLKALPRLWTKFYQIRDHILQKKPACTILIDYPGFNLRLAKALRKKGYQGKIVQYVCPSVWAHGKGRMQTMIDSLDLLLTIYPFEAALFSGTSLKTAYVGNPLIEGIQNSSYHPDWKKELGLPDQPSIVAIFPGSRPGEIIRHTPQQLRAASLLKARHPNLIFALSCAHENLYPILREQTEKSPLKLNQDIFLVPRKYSYELMKACKIALAKSGTVALELALHQKPSVIVYALTALNYLIAKYLLRLDLPYYCIVNILGQKEIFPELIQKDLNETALFQQMDRLMSNPEAYAKIEKDCANLKIQLGNHSASHEASQLIRALC